MITDSRVLLRRNLLHMRRYPSLTLLVAGMPIVFLLLFTYVFGGTLGNGLGTPDGGREAYLEYLVPGILLMTIAAIVQGTAISVAMDTTEGIVARFRTMPITRSALLVAHVLASVLQGVLAVLVVLAVALAIGYRPDADAPALLGGLGLIVLVGVALTWLAVGFGLAAKSVETASNSPMFLTLLPFVSSGFVPTDSMPTGLRQFAEYQPFTPIIETLRGLLSAAPTGGGDALAAVAWCVGVTVLGYVWSMRLWARPPVR